MPPEQVQLVREHDRGEHQVVRHNGCPSCLRVTDPPGHRFPGDGFDPEPWLEQLRRRRA